VTGRPERGLERWKGDVDDRDIEDRHDGAEDDDPRDLEDLAGYPVAVRGSSNVSQEHLLLQNARRHRATSDAPH
jgi:hypothetical protein